ncbi:MAG TPA: Zn-dependent alcohol dehydrogenase [Thermoanaerobaculia bacterium]|nr:Zn-dependent alcohol dehydrogenase [Thermoanaerobaculia bacterium]
MRAAVLREVPGELHIEEVEIGSPGPREVLIRTRAAGLCHSDLHFMEGKYPHPVPAVLGHESAGVVEAVGDQVRYVAPGDHVITCLSVYCGNCEACLTGHLSICPNKDQTARAKGAEPRLRQGDGKMAQFLHLSSFAEQMLVHEHALVKISQEVPFDRAALLGCSVTTGLGAVFNTARVEPGTTVAVIGCGGVGLNAVQGAALAGAGRVIAIDLLDSKLELARTFGATDVINAGEVDAVGAVKDLTGGGVHYSFEAIGSKTAAEQAFFMLRPGGTATIIGMIPVGEKIELPGHAFLTERRIQGSMMGSNRFRVDMPRYIDLYLQGRLKLDELVSARIGLDQVNEGFAAMRRGDVARSVIVFQG